MKFKIPYWPLLLGPIAAFGLGLALNAIAVAANFGQMMVLGPIGCPADASDPLHGCMSAASHLKWLSDVILYPSLGMMSIGDIFIFGGKYLLQPCLLLWAALMIKDAN